MAAFHPRLAFTTAVTGVLLSAIFAAAVIIFRGELREDIHQKIYERNASVLNPIAEAQLREAEADPSNQALTPEMLLAALLKSWSSWEQQGMLGVVLFDAEGNTLQALPTTLVATDLDPDDFARLGSGAQISRYYPEFPIERYFSDFKEGSEGRHSPVLEVMLPLHTADRSQTIGFVRYYMRARRLAGELAAIDARVDRQTAEILGIGGVLIALVLVFAYRGLARAQSIIAERNERLTRANFELTLAAKTSALGVITSHLIHGLQGPVAGLRAMVADRTASGAPAAPDWQSAADYTDRMQAMIHETVALLGDTSTQTSYELTGQELAASIRERNQAAAVAKGVALQVDEGFAEMIDSHRGSLICLIATNLIQNAIEATAPGRHVAVSLRRTESSFVVLVRDEGPGIPDAVREHLFEPGRSGRPGGTGLGLAISQLVARQISATLDLIATGPSGTTFRLTVPVG